MTETAVAESQRLEEELKVMTLAGDTDSVDYRLAHILYKAAVIRESLCRAR